MVNSQTWNQLIQRLPDPHILQTWEWGQAKGQYGWQSIPVIWPKDGEKITLSGEQNVDRYETSEISAAGLILKRSIQIPGVPVSASILYMPRGPLLDWADRSLRTRVLHDLVDIARQQHAIFIKIDPDIRMGAGVPGQQGSIEDATGYQIAAELQNSGWRFSDEQVQFRNTVLMDLSQSEEQLLTKMKQKTRYNLRLAERKGVTIRSGTDADLAMLYQMYAQTSVRDGFVIRDETYYHSLWKTFTQCEMAEPLIAEVEGQAVAALLLFFFGARAWYLFGMSTQEQRDKMPNHLLQWRAILRAKERGCRIYDLWGAPDEFVETDPLWGVYRFKEGLGGEVIRHIGAWDRPVNAIIYKSYTQILPRILNAMRRRGQERTRQQLSG